jgi:hypothetical protein
LHPIQIELWGDGDVGHTAASSGVMHCTICTSNLFGLYIRNEIEGAAKCVGVHVTVACCVHGRARVCLFCIFTVRSAALLCLSHPRSLPEAWVLIDTVVTENIKFESKPAQDGVSSALKCKALSRLLTACVLLTTRRRRASWTLAAAPSASPRLNTCPGCARRRRN